MNAPVIVVTGGNRGIGLEICRQLAVRGACVVLTARDAHAGESAAKSLSGKSGQVLFHPLDVTSDDSATKLATFLSERFGHCDVLINNAGMISTGDDAILTVPPAEVSATLESNAIGPLRVTQALLPLLRKASGGARIINVSSGAGELDDFDGSWRPAYSLSKAALNLVTRMLAAALRDGDGVIVNSMCPGWVKTDMGGEGAPRTVAQGADTAVWLALDAPKTLTGKFVRDRKIIPW